MSHRANTKNFSIHMDNDLFNRMESTRTITDSRSRGEYITIAVKLYGIYRKMNCDPIVFSKIIIGDIIQSHMNYVIHFEKCKWKKYVEQLEQTQLSIVHDLAKIVRIMADNMNMSPEHMELCHTKALNETQNYNDIIGFEDRMED